jgi:hypothetical protein
MNERIKLLAIQADWDDEFREDFDIKKFAELIVAECIDVFSKDLPEDSGKMLEVVNRVCNVAEHFGVEE